MVTPIPTLIACMAASHNRSNSSNTCSNRNKSLVYTDPEEDRKIYNNMERIKKYIDTYKTNDFTHDLIRDPRDDYGSIISKYKGYGLKFTLSHEIILSCNNDIDIEIILKRNEEKLMEKF